MQDLGIESSAEWVDALVNFETGVALVRHETEDGPDIVSVSSGDFVTNVGFESLEGAVN